MEHFHECLWPDGVSWRVVSVLGRAITYEFSHTRLGELGQIVISPIAEGSASCQLMCRCVTGGPTEVAAQRRAYLINLGEYIRKIFEERFANAIPAQSPPPAQLH